MSIDLDNFLKNLDHVSSIGLFVIGLISYNAWQDKIKKEKLESIKIELVYSIIDLVSSLEIHCNVEPSLSEQSESNKESLKATWESKDNICNESYNINMDITKKVRVFNKYVELFKFYNTHRNLSIEKDLLEFKTNINDFVINFYALINKKFYMYSNSQDPEGHKSFDTTYHDVNKKFKEIQDSYETILNELKNE